MDQKENKSLLIISEEKPRDNKKQNFFGLSFEASENFLFKMASILYGYSVPHYLAEHENQLYFFLSAIKVHPSWIISPYFLNIEFITE